VATRRRSAEPFVAAVELSAGDEEDSRARVACALVPEPDVPPVVREVTDVAEAASLVGAFARLIPQLSRSAPPPDEAVLAEIIAGPTTHLLVAEDGDGVLGSLTLVVFRIPTGQRAWIEDVVVDEAARGRGVGDTLNRFAIDVAAELGCRTVDLTSRPDRKAANRLYQRIGFEKRPTNVYRYTLEA
jgi:ribosomal protein S18 acetylase RimI-like enzyme